jgi:hypothetical protein
MSRFLSSFLTIDLTRDHFIQTWLVGNAAADILIASAMLYYVRMQRSFSTGVPELTLVLITTADHTTGRAGWHVQSPWLSEDCQIDR